MPRYFFNVHGESSVAPDLVGRDLPHDDAAREAANQLAKELVTDETLTGALPETHWVEVVDQDQRPVSLLPVESGVEVPNRLA